MQLSVLPETADLVPPSLGWSALWSFPSIRFPAGELRCPSVVKEGTKCPVQDHFNYSLAFLRDLPDVTSFVSALCIMETLVDWTVIVARRPTLGWWRITLCHCQDYSNILFFIRVFGMDD